MTKYTEFCKLRDDRDQRYTERQAFEMAMSAKVSANIEATKFWHVAGEWANSQPGMIANAAGDKMIAYVNAWGAEQREAGKAEAGKALLEAVDDLAKAKAAIDPVCDTLMRAGHAPDEAMRLAIEGRIGAAVCADVDVKLSRLLRYDEYGRNDYGYFYKVSDVQSLLASAQQAEAPKAGAAQEQPEKCRLRLCCRADAHAHGCTTYDPNRYPDSDAAPQPQPAAAGFGIGCGACGDDCKGQQCMVERDSPPCAAPVPASAPTCACEKYGDWRIDAVEACLLEDFEDEGQNHRADALRIIARIDGWEEEGRSGIAGDPASAAPVKDHVLREVVNSLRDTAIKFHNAQQLRERLRGCLDPLLDQPTIATDSGRDAEPAPQQASPDAIECIIEDWCYDPGDVPGKLCFDYADRFKFASSLVAAAQPDTADVRKQALEDAIAACMGIDVDAFGVFPVRVIQISEACATAIRALNDKKGSEK